MLNSPSGNIVNDIWLIPFHPNADKDASPIKGFDDTNYEPLLDYDFTMVFIQRLSQLNEASYFLEKKGYYKEWDKEDLTELLDLSTQSFSKTNVDSWQQVLPLYPISATN